MKDRLKQLRKNLNLTQQEFANKLNISRNNIASYETGKSNIGASVISLICKEFNVSEDWLRNGIEPIFVESKIFNLDDYARERGASEFDLKLLKAYLNLDKEVRDAITEQFKKEFGNQKDIYLKTDSDILTLEEANKIYEECPKTAEELDKLVINVQNKGIC